MRRLIKWIFRIAILLVVLVVVLFFSFDSIVKTIAERRIREQTGLDVKIGKMSVGLLSPVVTIKDFKLYNTAKFGGTLFVDIPELHVEYDREALADRKLHIKLLRFNLAELDIVKSEDGQTNIVEFMGKSQSGESSGTESLAQRLGGIKFTGIDVLNLSLGKLRFVDLKNPRLSTELKLDVRDQILKDVKTEGDLYGVLFLIWLRNGLSLKGHSMASPPELFSFPNAPPKAAAK